MFIPPEILTCVAYLGVELRDGNRVPLGTAFFVTYRVAMDGDPGYRDVAFLVTAGHVINKIALMPSSEVLVRVNVEGDSMRWIGTRVADWISHPTDSSVDVMAYRILWNPSIKLDHRTFPIEHRVQQHIATESVDLGDELFFPGLFWPHHGESRNIPIVRLGTIAAMPTERVAANFGGTTKKIDAYLAEVRSLGGLSGSPVFANMTGSRRGGIILSHPTPFRLLGLIRGHFDDELPRQDAGVPDVHRPIEKVNMGIATVVPAAKIFEVLEGSVARW